MRLLLIIAGLNLFLFTSSAQDDPTYGDDLLTWTKKEANKQSLELMNNDFPLRCRSYFIQANEHYFRVLDNISQRIVQLVELIHNQESALQRLPATQAALQREQFCTSISNQIVSLHDSISNLRKALQALPELSAREFFVSEGLYHVGTTNLMESMFLLGNHLKSTFQEVYGITFSISYSNGKVNYDYEFFPRNLTQYEQAGQSIVGSAGLLFDGYGTVAGYGSGVGTIIAAAAILSYNIWKGKTLQEKINEQNRKVDEAFTLLPKVLPEKDTCYKLYEQYFLHEKKATDTLGKKILAAADSVDNSLRMLFTYNFARLKVSETVLTAEKISELNKFFLGGKATPFQPRLIYALSKDFVKLDSATNMHYVSLPATREFSSFEALENYSDGIIELNALIDYFLHDKSYIPLWASLEQLKKEYALKMQEIPSLYQTIVSNNMGKTTIVKSGKLGKLTKAFASMKALEKKTAPDITRPKFKANISYGAEKYLVMDLANKNLAQKQLGYNFCLLYQNGNNFNCNSSGVPYAESFLPGRYGRNVLGSSFDGGYKSDLKRQNSEINSFKQNLRIRNANMKKQYADVSSS